MYQPFEGREALRNCPFVSGWLGTRHVSWRDWLCKRLSPLELRMWEPTFLSVHTTLLARPQLFLCRGSR